MKDKLEIIIKQFVKVMKCVYITINFDVLLTLNKGWNFI
jgi:hypothetical protein